MTNPLERIFDQFAIDSDAATASMSRDRPYLGQPWTHLGERGAAIVSGLTIRDLRDCYVRALCLSFGGGISTSNDVYYAEAEKGESACLSEEDVYNLQGAPDYMAVFQNMACEIEKMLGTYPNVPRLPAKEDET